MRHRSSAAGTCGAASPPAHPRRRAARVSRVPTCMSGNGECAGGSSAHNRVMFLDSDSCYRALATHDARFDGRFFVGVRSTRNLLPSGLHRAVAAARKLPLLPERSGGWIAAISPVPALPARARARPSPASMRPRSFAQAAVGADRGRRARSKAASSSCAARIGVTEPPPAPRSSTPNSACRRSSMRRRSGCCSPSGC